MQVLFYDNLTLNVSGIPMDQNKQQQSKFIHFLEPDFITSNARTMLTLIIPFILVSINPANYS